MEQQSQPEFRSLLESGLFLIAIPANDMAFKILAYELHFAYKIEARLLECANGM